MVDAFEGHGGTVRDPGNDHFQIAPNDIEDLPVVPRSIYCQSDGTVMVRDRDGVDLPYTMTAGQILPFRGRRVLATGTSGTFYGWS